MRTSSLNIELINGLTKLMVQFSLLGSLVIATNVLVVSEFIFKGHDIVVGLTYCCHSTKVQIMSEFD